MTKPLSKEQLEANRKKRESKPSQDVLMSPPEGKYKQQDITGGKILKETTPREIQLAAEHFFSRKADHACAKSNMEKAANEVLALMGKHKMTMVHVYDQDAGPKRITIKTGSERLKIENDIN